MIAFLATPFVAVAVWFVYTLAVQLVLAGRLSARTTGQSLIGGMTLGLVYTTLVTAGIGVPCYLVLRATVGVSGLTARVAGTAIGAWNGLAFIQLGALDSTPWLPGPVTGGVIGWVVAAVWWEIARRRDKEDE